MCLVVLLAHGSLGLHRDIVLRSCFRLMHSHLDISLTRVGTNLAPGTYSPKEDTIANVSERKVRTTHLLSIHYQHLAQHYTITMAATPLSMEPYPRLALLRRHNARNLDRLPCNVTTPGLFLASCLPVRFSQLFLRPVNRSTRARPALGPPLSAALALVESTSSWVKDTRVLQPCHAARTT